MGTTINRNLPYPDAGASDNVPYDMQQLADSIDAELGEDMDWEFLPFSSNYDAGATVAFRRIGNVVYLKGSAQRDSGSVTLSDVIGTLPESARPAQSMTFPTTGAGASTAKVNISSSTGVVTVLSAPTVATAYLSLDGITFLTD